MSEGTFLGRYEAKISEWEKLILEDPDNKEQYEDEMYTYMAECVPYLEKFTSDTGDKQTINTIFNTNVKKGLQRKDLYHDYLRKVERYTGVIEGEKEQECIKTIDMFKCSVCGTNNMFESNNSELVCPDCGNSVVIMVDELSYKDEQNVEKVVNYSYDRNNHFNEWILQFQAQEKTDINDNVIEQLRAEFKKQRVKNLKEITHAKVKALLKKLRLSKYYEHVPYISNILNGLKPPRMSQALEDKLRMMFRDVQEPFDKHCPGTRKNFLSYSYTLYKFCELLGEDEFLPCFPLLKSKEKLYQQDVIWKQMCKELQWEFIPTV